MKTICEFEVFGVRFVIERPITEQERQEQDYMASHKNEILKRLIVAPSVDVHEQFIVQVGTN